MTCVPVVQRDGTSWGIWCDWCQWGVAGLDSRRTADQAGQQHVRQRRRNLDDALEVT